MTAARRHEFAVLCCGDAGLCRVKWKWVGFVCFVGWLVRFGAEGSGVWGVKEGHWCVLDGQVGVSTCIKIDSLWAIKKRIGEVSWQIHSLLFTAPVSGCGCPRNGGRGSRANFIPQTEPPSSTPIAKRSQGFLIYFSLGALISTYISTATCRRIKLKISFQFEQ